VSATEYSQALPINFGAERIEQINKASDLDANARANAIDAARRQRHALIPLDPSNWRRLFVRNGRVLSALPELDADHPLQRPEHAASLLVAMKSLPFMRERVRAELGAGLAADEPTLLRPRPQLDQDVAEGEPTLLRQKLSIGSVAPESAKIYAFLDVQQHEQVVQRLAITGKVMIVGRVDPEHGTTPEIDLTPMELSNTVSRRHAQIYRENNQFSIEDLHSRNKTRLRGLELSPHKPEALQNGDAITFGSVKATFRLLGASQLPVSWSQS
jgi:hypothetical protein